MRMLAARTLVSLSLLFVAVAAPVASAEPVCGGKEQPACGPVAATFIGPASSCKAYDADAFWDPRNGGECWTCPDGFQRSLKPVTDGAACIKPLGGVAYGSSTFVKKADCGDGFFDPRNGGECWKCPDGANRTTYPVNEWNACVAEEQYKPATRYGLATGLLKTTCPDGQFWDPNGYCWSCPTSFKRTAFAVTTEKACYLTGRVNLFATLLGPRCPGTSFWDMRNGGECWSCQTGFIRTAMPVTDAKACMTTAAEVSVATYKGKWACAQGQIWDPKQVPNGNGGLSASCWSCPDQTKRSIYPVDGPKACNSGSFRWNTPAYTEPGLFGLRTDSGALAITNLMLEAFRDPTTVKSITGFLYAYRAGRGDTGAALDAAVAGEWELIATKPQASAALKAYLYAYLEAIGIDGATRQTESDFVAAWEKYIRDRKIYTAQDARNAYESWKIADAWAKEQQAALQASTGAPNNMLVLFDYGRVPPKFAETAEANIKQGFAQAGATLGAVAALGTPAVLNGAALTKWMLPFRAVKTVGGKAPMFGGIGPQIIVMIAIIVLETAIDQIIDIATMDARLRSTLELASRAVSLNAKLAEVNGKEKMASMWGVAMESSTLGPTPAFLTAAGAARNLAIQNGYWAAELR